MSEVYAQPYIQQPSGGGTGLLTFVVVLVVLSLVGFAIYYFFFKTTKTTITLHGTPPPIVAQTYDCDKTTKKCSKSKDNSGKYSTLAACQTACNK